MIDRETLHVGRDLHRSSQKLSNPRSPADVSRLVTPRSSSLPPYTGQAPLPEQIRHAVSMSFNGRRLPRQDPGIRPGGSRAKLYLRTSVTDRIIVRAPDRKRIVRFSCFPQRCTSRLFYPYSHLPCTFIYHATWVDRPDTNNPVISSSRGSTFDLRFSQSIFPLRGFPYSIARTLSKDEGRRENGGWILA